MSKESNEIVFIGYSGHAYTVIDIAQKLNYHPTGYFDLLENSDNPYQLSYLGNEREFDFSKFTSCVFPAIGDNRLRMKIHHFIQKNKLNECHLIHPSAILGFKSGILQDTGIYFSNLGLIESLGNHLSLIA